MTRWALRSDRKPAFIRLLEKRDINNEDTFGTILGASVPSSPASWYRLVNCDGLAKKTVEKIWDKIKILDSSFSDYFIEVRGEEEVGTPSARHEWSAEQCNTFVCFAQIENTSGIDGHIQSALTGFCSSLHEAVGNSMANISEETSFGRRLLAHAEPTCKLLGDGAMLIWEYPSSEDSHEFRTGFAILVLDYIRYLQDQFYSKRADLMGQKPFAGFGQLELVVGLSRGTAWKISGGERSRFCSESMDYWGTPLMQARDLVTKEAEGKHGIIAEVNVAPDVFMERSCFGEGDFRTRKGDKGVVWECAPTMSRRQARDLSNYQSARRTVPMTGDKNFVESTDKIALNEADTHSVFDVREQWEVQFAQDLATRIDADVGLRAILIDRLADKEVRNHSFHSIVAELSNPDEGAERAEFAKWAHESTSRVYDRVKIDSDTTIEQHEAILDAICSGNSKRAGQAMKRHLQDHCNEGRRIVCNV